MFSVVLFFFPLRAGFEQDVENIFPQYPDSCHGMIGLSVVLMTLDD